MGQWSNWTPCVGGMVTDCSAGKKTRIRTISQLPQNGGKRCKGSLIGTKWCNTDCQCLRNLVDDGGQIMGTILDTVEQILDANC